MVRTSGPCKRSESSAEFGCDAGWIFSASQLRGTLNIVERVRNVETMRRLELSTANRRRGCKVIKKSGCLLQRRLSFCLFSHVQSLRVIGGKNMIKVDVAQSRSRFAVYANEAVRIVIGNSHGVLDVFEKS